MKICLGIELRCENKLWQDAGYALQSQWNRSRNNGKAPRLKLKNYHYIVNATAHSMFCIQEKLLESRTIKTINKDKVILLKSYGLVVRRLGCRYGSMNMRYFFVTNT